MNDAEARIVREFHNLYYNGPGSDGPIFQNTYWMGVPCLKCPLDLWCYQEILVETRPDLIIETGTHAGGSALFLAHICDMLDHGHVATIDLHEQARPVHRRISYVKGSSSEPRTIDEALSCKKSSRRVLVILDSDHSEPHVTRELELLSPFVSPGSYIIVEDTNINGHPTYPAFGPGPFEAVQKFLGANPSFVIDASREKFLMTFNPKGFLKRIR
jgi:cephalosporin hydroxylase